MAHDHRGRPIADPHMHVVEAMRSRSRRRPGPLRAMSFPEQEGYIDPEDMHGFSFMDENEGYDDEDYVNDPHDDEDYDR